MGSKTISIKDEAYERLKRRKGEDKSFSDVILQLTEGDRRDFTDLIGADIDVAWEEVKAARERNEEDEEREELLTGH